MPLMPLAQYGCGGQRLTVDCALRRGPRRTYLIEE